MKSKEITEGFFKGLAKGIGYDDGSPSASNAEIGGAEIDGAGDECQLVGRVLFQDTKRPEKVG